MKYDKSQLIEPFRQFAAQQRLIERAFKSCRESLTNCVKENEWIDVQPLNGYDLNEIQLHFDKQSLVFAHGVLSYPFIDTQLGLYVHDPHEVHASDLIPK